MTKGKLVILFPYDFSLFFKLSRFNLNYRDIQKALADWGSGIYYSTIQRWVKKGYGPFL